MSDWQKATELEKNWWGDCRNTLGEEMKQLVYAKKMGIELIYHQDSPYYFKAKGKILDIGGGPVSMLLKCTKDVQGTVVDPCEYPNWIAGRYHEAGIEYYREKAEDLTFKEFDEVWIYNVLQHVVDPEKIINLAKAGAKTIRIFEWVDHGTNEMHPHNLTTENLKKWLATTPEIATDKTSFYGEEDINENGCVGKCFYGVFHY